MLRIPWSVNLNRLMYVAMTCLLGEFVCADCGEQDPLKAVSKIRCTMSMRVVRRCGQPHTVESQATFAGVCLRVTARRPDAARSSRLAVADPSPPAIGVVLVAPIAATLAWFH